MLCENTNHTDDKHTLVLTGLTQLEALPACQLLVQRASQHGGQQQDGPAHGRVVGGDQSVGHEGDAALGLRGVACGGIPETF